MKKILLIATGGTIACTQQDSGLTPSLDVSALISYVPQIKNLCELSCKSIMNIDSSNMNPKLMADIAQTIYDNFNEFDGFVITHGTDTLAYTAAGLSYMLCNLSKPVILTGSQLPIEADGTDAIENLYDAVHYACLDYCGVYVSFNRKLIVGTCAKKVNTKDFDAFESVNCPPGVKQPALTGKFSIDTAMCADVLVIKILPGMNTGIFDCIAGRYRGVILECFGLGGLPDTDSDILKKLHALTETGVAVVITTQCIYEGIDLSVYSVGQNLKKIDIIDGGTATTEALTMKLMWALAHFEKISDIKQFMEKVTR